MQIMLALFIISSYNKHMSSNNAQTEKATGKYRKTRLDRSSKMNLLKYSGNIYSAPRKVLQDMNECGAEFVTWTNSFSGGRFIAQKSTIEKLAHNKFCMKKDELFDIKDNEIVEIGSSLTVDEVLFEMDANNTDEIELKSGFSEKNKITRESTNLLSEVLYNNSFDCSILFKNK